jgi:hypothetical protein
MDRQTDRNLILVGLVQPEVTSQYQRVESVVQIRIVWYKLFVLCTIHILLHGPSTAELVILSQFFNLCIAKY